MNHAFDESPKTLRLVIDSGSLIGVAITKCESWSHIVVDRDDVPLGMILTTAPVSVCTVVEVAYQCTEFEMR